MPAKHFLSWTRGGVPFDCSHNYANGNMVANMYANVTAEATGRVLATRLYEVTDGPGMKDMLASLIARDTMHQNQWLAAIEDMGGNPLPIPNSFLRCMENQEFSYAFMARASTGQEPSLSAPETEAHAQDQEKSGIRSTLKAPLQR
jgi:Mn-containing catalase